MAVAVLLNVWVPVFLEYMGHGVIGLAVCLSGGGALYLLSRSRSYSRVRNGAPS